jgi:two-component system cell cycle response regulator DivK
MDPNLVVLVVEDSESVYEMFSDALAEAGCRVVGASDGAEALDVALAVHPDVIVMDLQLPTLDGIQATRRLRGHPQTRDAGIVMVTGRIRGGWESEAKAAGCDLVLYKPCSLTLLLETIRSLGAKRAREAQP